MPLSKWMCPRIGWVPHWSSCTPAGTDGPGTVQLTGRAVVQQDVNHLSFRDLERAEMVGLTDCLIVLCFAFRGLYAALIAVMMGISAVITAMGVTSLLGYHWNCTLSLM